MIFYYMHPKTFSKWLIFLFYTNKIYWCIVNALNDCSRHVFVILLYQIQVKTNRIAKIKSLHVIGISYGFDTPLHFPRTVLFLTYFIAKVMHATAVTQLLRSNIINIVNRISHFNSSRKFAKLYICSAIFSGYMQFELSSPYIYSYTRIA